MTEIAGYYGQLANALREKGHFVTFIGGNAHPLGYEKSHENNSQLIALYERFSSARQRTPRKRFFRKLLYMGSIFVLRWIIFCWALSKHDVFIFGFGSSLLPKNLDLPVLNLLKKRLICNIAHGSDARPPYVDGSYLNKENKHLKIESLRSRTKSIKSRCIFIGKYADLVMGAPLSSQFINKKFINFFQIGIPYSIKSVPNTTPCGVSSIRILHCPSHPQAKGTMLIRRAIKSLQQKGYNLQLIEIIGQPNSAVLKELSLCDFVVDQVYSDTPMAGFATEAAWFRKPAVVGGYGFEKLHALVSESMWPPSKTCHPDKIEQAIEDLIVNVEERHRLGLAAQTFVREKWSAMAVACRYLQLIDGDIPEEWWLDPKAVVYVEGAGQSVEQTKDNIRKMVDKFGPESLHLSHRSDLEQAFLEFAGVKQIC